MIAMCLTAAALLMTGCAKTRLEMDYGTSYKLQKYNQILNPEAENNIDPVYGLDGRAAQAAMEKYRKGFEKTPAAANIYNISLGTTSSN
jgi:hypothetical protein